MARAGLFLLAGWLLGRNRLFQALWQQRHAGSVVISSECGLQRRFLLVLSSLQFQADHSSRLVRACSVIGSRIAAFSFTLYVGHVPFLFLLRNLNKPLSGEDLSPHELEHFAVYTAIPALIIFLSYLFHWPFEAQTLRVRGWIKEVLYRHPRPGLKGAAVSARRG